MVHWYLRCFLCHKYLTPDRLPNLRQHCNGDKHVERRKLSTCKNKKTQLLQKIIPMCFNTSGNSRTTFQTHLIRANLVAMSAKVGFGTPKGNTDHHLWLASCVVKDSLDQVFILLGHRTTESMDAERLHSTSVDVMKRMSLDKENMFAFVGDRCSTNILAAKHLRDDYNAYIPCLAHCLSTVGEKFRTFELDIFFSTWSCMM
eukprot:g7164.t1